MVVALLLVALVAFVLAKLVFRKKNGDIVDSYISRAESALREVDSAPLIEDNEIFEDCLDETKKRKYIRHNGLFKSYLVQQAKAKFGTPSRTSANVMCVRKYLYDECLRHGVVARHIAQNLDFAVEATFMPTDAELMAMAVRKTKMFQDRVEVRRALSGEPTPQRD